MAWMGMRSEDLVLKEARLVATSARDCVRAGRKSPCCVPVDHWGCPGHWRHGPWDRRGPPVRRWVTAAKSLVASKVAIDMLAGPSEVLVLADDSADRAGGRRPPGPV